MESEKMAKNLSEKFDEVKVGDFLGEGTYKVTKEEIARFAKLLGYDDPIYFNEEYAKKTEYGGIITPPGMILVYGLYLDADLNQYPAGSVRMGDENEFFSPARPGDILKTTVTVSDRFVKKGRKFIKAKVETRNQKDEQICIVDYTCIIP